MYRIIGILFWQTICAVFFTYLAFQLKLEVSASLAGLVGALFGGLIWLIRDLTIGDHYFEWLRVGPYTELPNLAGRWGEIANRTYRLLSEKDQNLVTSNQRLVDFLSAIQASPNGVILLDQNGQIEWCNLTAANHFGLNPEADIFQHLGNLVRDPNFVRYFNAGNYSDVLNITTHNATNNKITRLAIQIHRYGQGKKLVLSNDVTAIETAELMRRDFVANVSHEIRTPLTVLSGFVETLQSIDVNEAQRDKYLDLIQQQTHRIQLLVNDLLALSKIEGNPLPSVDTWLSASDLFAACKIEAEALNNDLHNISKVEKHAMQFDVQAQLEVAGSRTELLSAMCNLINNAIRYTPKGGNIHVSFLAMDGGGAIFSVVDTGLGILPEHLPRLTERFYRVDASRSRESGGTGLGLAIVKHVIQRHGGELKITSSIGKGSTFSFTLPGSRIRIKSTA